MQTLLEAIGWIGSALIVLSVMQSRMLRFRWMNLSGSIVATGYNLVLEIWPFVAMNAAIALISAYWLTRLYREAKDPAVYQVLEVAPDSPFLQHLLEVHADDIAAHQPGFAAQCVDPDPELSTLLLVRGDEAVGVVAVRNAGDGVGVIELDWVKPRFRDFSPGHFVYNDSGALPAAGFRHLTLTPHEATDTEYLRRIGFRLEGEQWVRDLSISNTAA
jgi:hypothetical protein